MKVRYRWKTDGGYFTTQDERTTEFLDLGRETVTEGGKLFWSYAPGEESELASRPVWDGQAFRARH